jgi:phenylacetate-CoA ligase
MQVQAMTLLRPKAYVGTPSFLKIIIEKAQEMGEDIRSVRYALVGAEALPPSLRTWLNEHGVPHVLQTYGSADIGNIAYETLNGDQVNPGMVLDETLMLEIVRPGTGEPVSDGEVGEVVITSFNPDYPLIRFATGDLSAVLTGISPCDQRLDGARRSNHQGACHVCASITSGRYRASPPGHTQSAFGDHWRHG